MMARDLDPETRDNFERWDLEDRLLPITRSSNSCRAAMARHLICLLKAGEAIARVKDILRDVGLGSCIPAGI